MVRLKRHFYALVREIDEEFDRAAVKCCLLDSMTVYSFNFIYSYALVRKSILCIKMTVNLVFNFGCIQMRNALNIAEK